MLSSSKSGSGHHANPNVLRKEPKGPNNRAIAFAFDIDGVLVNGKTPISGARDALLKLQKSNVPFMFLTNSGGVTEKANLDKLATRLGDIAFDEKQIVQSHTPFLEIVHEYRDKTVLVLGGHGDNVRELAKAYGFNHVVTSSDIMARSEHIHPFPEMTQQHHDKHGQKGERDGKPFQISAILLWSSPRDWCLDLQVTLDLLLSCKGIVGTRSAMNGNPKRPNNGYLQDGQPKLYFCNPDFEWSTKYQQPRLAQGAFREALLGIWNRATKGTAVLKSTTCGKPTKETYLYGERVLRNLILAVNAEDAANENRTVYMIGDNPESDIAGANAYTSQFGWKWRSVLVETGVYSAGTKPAHVPSHTAKNVAAAVEWALAQEEIVLE